MAGASGRSFVLAFSWALQRVAPIQLPPGLIGAGGLWRSFLRGLVVERLQCPFGAALIQVVYSENLLTSGSRAAAESPSGACRWWVCPFVPLAGVVERVPSPIGA